MNTPTLSNGTGHRLGLSEVLLFLGGLIVVVGLLVAVLYSSAPRQAAPAGVAEPATVSDATDPHVLKESLIAAANAKRALAEQRRGEWLGAAAVTAGDALQDQRKGEWTVERAPSAQDAYQEQRRGEWMIAKGANANQSSDCYSLPDRTAQAMCLGVR